MSETVIIKDSSGRSCRFEISTSTSIKLSFDLWRCGNATMFRPKSWWGDDWSANDLGFIKHTSGEVWYKRSGADLGSGMEPLGDVRHLDIFLFIKGIASQDDWGILLRSFISLNGTNSSGGGGYLDMPWVLQAAPGDITWDIPGRYASS